MIKEKIDKIKNIPEDDKKKRGRPAKVDEVLKQKELFLELGLTSEGIIELVFDIVAGKHGKHWILTKDEKIKLSKATDKMLEKYLPLYFKYIIEVNFGIVLIAIAYPRIKIDVANAKKVKEEKGKEKSKEEKVIDKIDKKERKRNGKPIKSKTSKK